MKWLLPGLLLAGCVGQIGEDFVGEDTHQPPPMVALAIASPADGAMFPRTYLTADGSFVAEVAFTATGGAEVKSVEWLVAGARLGEGMSFTGRFADEGEQTAEAVARDGAGRELARRTVRFRVMGAPAADCLGKLDALGISYTLGPASAGIPVPVTVTLPLNGVQYRRGSAEIRTKHLMDCELALRLWRGADLWKARDVAVVRDYGIYNYRCIDQSVSPPCPGSKLSMHAYAQAIDIAGFETSDGTYYSVNDDWVIDPDAERTCSAATEAGKDEWLHEAICEMFDNDVFHIYLTPNYNTAHRNHFHVDLTPNASSISKAGWAFTGPDDE